MMGRKRFILLATLVVSSLGLWSGWASDGGPSLLERDRYLLLDSRIIASTENAELVLGEVQKYEGNPLFEEDKPWEKRLDNLYANVLYDEEEGLYKCWYSPFIVDESAKGMTLEERKEKKYRAPWTREMAICYATSEDGITWVKPELGIVEFASPGSSPSWGSSNSRGAQPTTFCGGAAAPQAKTNKNSGQDPTATVFSRTSASAIPIAATRPFSSTGHSPSPFPPTASTGVRQ
jgi:hypothetical protein